MKERNNRIQKVHTKIHPKTTQSLSKNLFPLFDLTIKVFLANTTPVYSISFQVLLQVYIEDVTFPTSSIYKDKELNCWFFGIIRNYPTFIHPMSFCGAYLVW